MKKFFVFSVLFMYFCAGLFCADAAGAADTAEIISGKKAIQKAAALPALKAAEALLK